MSLLLLFGLVMFCNPEGIPGCLAFPFVFTGGLTEVTTARGAGLGVTKVRRSVRPLILTVSDRELES